MAEAGTAVLIYTTWPDSASAEAAAGALVAQGLAACVNILGPATAIYAWQGEIERDTEHPMLIKTRPANVDAVVATVRQMHPYEVPAVAVLPITGGDRDFLAWIGAQTDNPIPITDGGNDATD